MKTLTGIYKNKWTIQEIEFTLLLACLLLYPKQEGWPYFLIFTSVAAISSLRRIIRLRNLALNPFSLFLLVFNLLVIGAALFSSYPLKSIRFAADLLLISTFFLFWESPAKHPRLYLSLTGLIISASSLANLISVLLQPGQRQASLFFVNPILQGIASGAAVILFLSYLLERLRLLYLAGLLLNAAAMVITAAKAPFLGTVLLALYLLLIRKKSWIKYLAVFLLLITLIPNPLKRMTLYSLKNDPYVFDRILIWKMSLKMFAHHPWTGIGPALFAEQALRFNFRQNKGDSRYGKVPESPHSDYLKIAVELGVAGLAAMLVFLLLLLRKVFQPPWQDPVKLIMIFFLFQSLLFNYLFEPFFFFVLLLMLKCLLEIRSTYVSPPAPVKLAFTGLVLGILMLVNIFPAYAFLLTQKALHTNPVRAFVLLQKAEKLDPANPQIPFLKGEFTLGYYKAKGTLEAAVNAIGFFRESQRKNPFETDYYAKEAEVYQVIRAKKRTYQGMAQETLEPLNRAERLNPFNPFLKFQKALVHWHSGNRMQAETCARQALDLEPDFIFALYFLHQNYGYLDEAAFHDRIQIIRKKIAGRKFPADKYLDKLFRFPAEPLRQGEADPYSTSASSLTSK